MVNSGDSLREITYICPGRSIPSETQPDDSLKAPFTVPLKGSEEIVLILEIPHPDQDPDRHVIRLTGSAESTLELLYCVEHGCTAPLSSISPLFQ